MPTWSTPPQCTTHIGGDVQQVQQRVVGEAVARQGRAQHRVAQHVRQVGRLAADVHQLHAPPVRRARHRCMMSGTEVQVRTARWTLNLSAPTASINMLILIIHQQHATPAPFYVVRHSCSQGAPLRRDVKVGSRASLDAGGVDDVRAVCALRATALRASGLLIITAQVRGRGSKGSSASMHNLDKPYTSARCNCPRQSLTDSALT